MKVYIREQEDNNHCTVIAQPDSEEENVSDMKRYLENNGIMHYFICEWVNPSIANNVMDENTRMYDFGIVSRKGTEINHKK